MQIRLVLRSAMTLAFAALALEGCGGGGGNSSYSSPTGTTGNTGNTGGTGSVPPNTVQATENATFNPATLTVAKGTTVTFTFGSLTHNVTFSTAGAPTNIPDASGQSVSRNFPNAGVFNFTCTIHGSYMTGSITVQ